MRKCININAVHVSFAVQDDPLDGHKYNLIRLLAAGYIECRLHHALKEEVVERNGKFTKTKNQLQRAVINTHR